MTSNTNSDMVRRGIIMTGYHSEEFTGDVLTKDGEVLGTWWLDEDEWCYFQKTGETEPALSAPSRWMLQDSLADFYKF